MYSMILALGLAPAGDVADCRLLTRSRTSLAVETRSGGCSGTYTAPPVTLLAPPATYAVPAPTGCSGSYGASRTRSREVYRERGRSTRGGGCSGGSAAYLVVPNSPPPAAPQAAPPPAVTPEKKLDPAAAVVLLVNDYRARCGLAALALSPELCRSSSAWAVHMRVRGMYHSGAAGIGENVALGQVTPAEVVRDWIASPGHRANMVGTWSTIGVGVAYGPDGRAAWCLQLH